MLSFKKQGYFKGADENVADRFHAASCRERKEFYFMRLALVPVTAVLLMSFFTGCATVPSADNEDKELSSLVSALVENSLQMKKKAAEQAGMGIKNFNL